MPYTPAASRVCRPYFEAPAANAGDLTFQLTCVVQHYLEEHAQGGVRYQHIDEITGALAQCQRDFDERVTSPYEALKIQENGDVWQALIEAGIVPTPVSVKSASHSTRSSPGSTPGKAATSSSR